MTNKAPFIGPGTKLGLILGCFALAVLYAALAELRDRQPHQGISPAVALLQKLVDNPDQSNHTGKSARDDGGYNYGYASNALGESSILVWWSRDKWGLQIMDPKIKPDDLGIKGTVLKATGSTEHARWSTPLGTLYTQQMPGKLSIRSLDHQQDTMPNMSP